jgi:nucleotide-binding universal stress UspA family protein
MHERILLPYDGSEGAGEMLHHASEVAHWFDATIQLLYVADRVTPSICSNKKVKPLLATLHRH